MNKEEIKKALEIIREPITVNCKDYHYFDNDNYSKLLNVYENCLWFINNFEQINDVVERLEQENNQLKEQLKIKHDGFMASIDQNCEYATILIELRSWLEEEIKQGRSEDNLWLMGCYDECKEVLSKLNELEGGKNE